MKHILEIRVLFLWDHCQNILDDLRSYIFLENFGQYTVEFMQTVNRYQALFFNA